MTGIQAHTHAERAHIARQLIPLLQQKFGATLLAIAAQGSFARGDDGPYSDLELIAFVQNSPADGSRGYGKIYQGMLIEVVWKTPEHYLRDVQKPSEDWYLAGSDQLLPLYGAPFIQQLEARKQQVAFAKFLDIARHHWHKVQESTAKVLNALHRNKRQHLPLLLFDMYRHMAISLALLNQQPYTTFATILEEAIQLEWTPEGFIALSNKIVKNPFQDMEELQLLVEQVFTGLEQQFEQLGVRLYDTDFAPH